MSSPAYHIRPATEDDIDSILQLVRELAIYEKAEESAKATPELVMIMLQSDSTIDRLITKLLIKQIKQNLFTTPFAHALLAVSPEGQATGLALYFFNFSTWTGRPGLYLEDLFVMPEHRSKGIGKVFFAELARVAQEKNCARMDWAVLKWNKPSIDFYEKALGAFPMSEWMGMRLEEEGIENLKKFSIKE